MTKKSINRQQRDEQLSKKIKDEKLNITLKEARKMNLEEIPQAVIPANRSWDELLAIYNSINEQIGLTNLQLSQAYNDQEILKFLENPKEVSTVLRGHANDLRKFQEELSAIYNSHKELVGGVENEEQMYKAFALGEAYNDFQTRYSCVIMPNVNFLIESIATAFDNYEKTKKQEALTDVNVISDVEIKQS